MTKKHFWIGVACLYGFGLAVALLIRAGEPLPASTQGWLALLATPSCGASGRFRLPSSGSLSSGGISPLPNSACWCSPGFISRSCSSTGGGRNCFRDPETPVSSAVLL